MVFGFNENSITPVSGGSGGGGGGTASPVVVFAGGDFNHPVGGSVEAIETKSMPAGVVTSFDTQLTVPEEGYYLISSTIKITSSATDGNINIAYNGNGNVGLGSYQTSLAETTYPTVSIVAHLNSGENVSISVGTTRALQSELQRYHMIKLA